MDYISKQERRELVSRCFFACAYTAALMLAAGVMQFIASSVV